MVRLLNGGEVVMQHLLREWQNCSNPYCFIRINLMRAVSEHWRCERRPGCYNCSWNHALAAYLPTFQIFKVVDLADRLSLVPMAACSCKASCPLSPHLLERPAASCSCKLGRPSWKNHGLFAWILLLSLSEEARHYWSYEQSTLPQWLCACHLRSSRNFAKWTCWTRDLALADTFLGHQEEQWTKQHKDGLQR